MHLHGIDAEEGHVGIHMHACVHRKQLFRL